MRKIVAVFLTWALLILSSVPLSVEAAGCVLPEHEMSSEQEADHGHDHVVSLIGDWQQDRIECGCGCHRSVDSLPHLLAPYAMYDGGLEISASFRLSTIMPDDACFLAARQVPLPPPQQL